MVADGLGVGFLVVGAGFLGKQRAAAVMASRGCRLVAVHDSNIEAARALASKHGAKVVDDYNVALESDDVDAVIVATPHADHYEQVRLALEAGKHVLCEKPLTVTPSQARHLAIRADELKLRLATGFNHRFYPPIQKALALVGDWAIGKIVSVKAVIGHKATPEFLQSWHTQVERSGGGTLMDNGPHACDLMRRFLGEVVSAQGTVKNTLDLPSGCESEATATFKGNDRGQGQIHSSWTLATGYLTIDIEGTEGKLHVETAPWKLNGVLANGRRLRRYYLGERFSERRFRGLYGCERSFVRELESFVAKPNTPAAVLGATGWDGHRTTEMIDAVYRSAAEGGVEVALQPNLLQFPAEMDVQASSGDWA
ncbi:Gfo/Idh/MocA family protein [Singulisphaera sp. PoT]|uniref:Gfo/Idh/MocA family protein n=1 Tax=Singulisphaera sp. PoT TaxID=3411797 RepID=UPI003BF5325C